MFCGVISGYEFGKKGWNGEGLGKGGGIGGKFGEPEIPGQEEIDGCLNVNDVRILL